MDAWITNEEAQNNATAVAVYLPAKRKPQVFDSSTFGKSTWVEPIDLLHMKSPQPPPCIYQG
jgi:hypothetical protein